MRIILPETFSYLRSRREAHEKNGFLLKVQSNLPTTATLGTPKKRPLYRGGRSLEGFQLKLVLELVRPDLFWPLLTGGRYLEVAVSTGLTLDEMI
jgi:hypothetical protein